MLPPPPPPPPVVSGQEVYEVKQAPHCPHLLQVICPISLSHLMPLNTGWHVLTVSCTQTFSTSQAFQVASVSQLFTPLHPLLSLQLLVESGQHSAVAFVQSNLPAPQSS